LSHPKFSNIHYHAIAGTYGIQEGLYVQPKELLSFEKMNGTLVIPPE
jgi:hypothetical protein